MRTPESRTRSRWAIVAATIVLCALYSVYYTVVGKAYTRPDFDQFWGAARAVVAGRDPYTSVGPGRWFEFNFPFYYPLPVVVLALPFAALPLTVARAVYSAVCGGIFAMALTRDNLDRTPALLSFSMVIAMQYGQLSPLLAAAFVYPWFAGLVAAKPSAGLAAVAAQSTTRDLVRAAVVAGALVAVSFVLFPAWPMSWFDVLRDNPLVAPIFRPFGALLLLSLLRWRRAEARWITVIALVPLTSPFYESLPLFMAPFTFRQSLILALLTHAARWLMFLHPKLAFFDALGADATIAIVVVYLPAVFWLLRRPNEARVASGARPSL